MSVRSGATADGRDHGRDDRGDRSADEPRGVLVLLAAGSGTRVGAGSNKVLLPLAGRRVLTWSLAWTQGAPWCVATVVVVRAEDEAEVRAVLAEEAPGRAVEVVVGGATRHESEDRALRLLARRIRSGELDVVVVHDAARPLSGPGVFADVVRAAHELGGALPVLHQDGIVGADPSWEPPERLVTVQTPQAFRALELLDAYDAAEAAGFAGTDTASCMERFSRTAVHGLPGAATNIKVTFPEDLLLAERILARNDLPA